jgi:ribosomal protein S18 acetylase RimI-like enzyme
VTSWNASRSVETTQVPMPAASARGEGGDHVVRLPPLELEVAVAERLDDRAEVRELLAEQVRHRPAAFLVRLRELGAVHRPGVPGDRDTLRPVVGEELEEHVREAEQRARGEALARRQLLRQRKVGPVGEVVAVYEEELGLARGGVVELELLTRQRLRRHLCECTSVSRTEIVPFSDEHLDGAAALLAARHARHRAAEPLLPSVADFRTQVEHDWRADAASGAAAVRNGAVVGYLIGRDEESWAGRYLWVRLASHAAREPGEIVRDLYAAAAKRWVEEGLTKQFVFVPPIPDLVEPWFRLSFGLSAVTAARETALEPVAELGLTIRPSTPADLHDIARLDRMLRPHLNESPSFSGLEIESEESYRDEWSTLWDEGEHTHFVADQGGEIVGHVLLYRRPAGDLRLPPGSIDLADALTEPGARRSGVGTALTNHALSWAHAHGFRTMTTDWRVTNLEASRFWPRRGFRETFLRLYRSIP